MHCPKCGSQEDGHFCTRCGTEIIYSISDQAIDSQRTQKQETKKIKTQTKDKEPQHKDSKRRLRLICILIIVFAAICAAGYFFGKWYFSAEQRISRAIKDEKLTEAIGIYHREIEGEENGEITEYLQNKLEQIQNDYSTELVDYTIAIDRLQQLDDLEYAPIQTEINSARENLEELYASREAYCKGNSFYQSGEYLAAADQYAHVIEQDKYYLEANEKRAYCIHSYREIIIGEAESFANKALFEEAIAQIDIGLQELQFDEELSAKRQEYVIDLLNQQKQDALASAEAAADAGDYSAAIKAIAAVFEYNPDDVELKTAYTRYSEAFVSKVIMQADTLMSSFDYEKAVSLINEALKTLPRNEVLNSKLEDIKTRKPISITDAVIVNGDFPWNRGVARDPFGVDHSFGTNYAIFEYSYGAYNVNPIVTYAEYRLYGKYRCLKGSLVPYESIYETGTAVVKVLADDVLIYTSPAITRKTDLFSFEADVTGAEYIKIEVTVSGRTSIGSYIYDAGAVILKDFMLYS